MDENNPLETSPNPAIDRDMSEGNSKVSDTLKNDAADDTVPGNNFSHLNGNIFVNEANKIFQMGIEKDFAILEKNKMLQDAMEMIENMKKNMYHIQTEYEKLDQQYQTEISNASEALRRVNITRGLVESASNYSDILAMSIKQLEDDKFKIAEFYNELYTRQEEEEEKRRKLEIIIKEQEDLTKNRVSQLMSEKTETEQKLKVAIYNLSEMENKLMSEKNKKDELQIELEKCKDEMKEMKSNLTVEQTTRIKYQVLQSQLKKRILQQKTEDEKSFNLQKIFYKRKLKVLMSELKNFRERLNVSEKSIPNYLSTISDLEAKVIELNDNYQKANENHVKEVEELKEKLKIYLTENGNLDDVIQRIEQEKMDEYSKVKTLTEENLILMNAQETIKLTLQEKENEVEKLLGQNLNLERKQEELLLEINDKAQKIDDLQREISSQNTEELLEKIKIYSEKLLKCDTVENELRNEIVFLNETMSKECSEKEKIILEHQLRIQHLEKEVLELEAQKSAAEKQMNENYSEYNQVKNELSMKSADLEKITQEFESKMKMVSTEAELFEQYKIELEEEKEQNKELLQRVQKLEEEKAILDGNLLDALEREKLLNKNMARDKEEMEKTIRQLNYGIEEREKILRSKEEKLNEAKNEILERGKLSEKLQSSEKTIKNLKESLESSEANLEAYKIVIQKLEAESTKIKNVESETIKKLQNEISQLKKLNQKNENSSVLMETPKSRNTQMVNKVNNTSSGSNKAPSTSRRLFSTPKRLLDSPYPAPNFSSISPIRKTRDPYEFDSDCSIEQLNTNTLTTSSSKKIFTSRRRK